MTTHEAKQILLTYRSWANDVQDAEVKEALELCRQDPGLCRWLENHCAVQNAIRSKLTGVTVPEGLREQIVSELGVRNLTVWWRRPAAVAAIACLAICISAASIWLSIPHGSSQDVSFASYRNRMLRTAVRSYGMDLETSDESLIRTHLARHKSHADYVLPQKLQQTGFAGCAALTWQGRPVAMVCFKTGKPLAPGDKSDLFLFVVERKQVPDLCAAEEPEYVTLNNMTTATWLHDGKVYMLAGFADSDLRTRL